MTNSTTAAQNPIAEKFFERHAWKVLLSLSIIIGYFGIGDIVNGAADLQTGETVLMHRITGASWNELVAASPRIANLINLKFKTEGTSLMIIAAFTAIVCLTSFRRGEPLAWGMLWLFLLWSALTVLLGVEKMPGIGTPVTVFSGLFFCIISTLTLLLSSRKFLRRA